MSVMRDYQQAAFDSAMNSMSKSTDSVLIEAATGAGKSHIIAALANKLYQVSQGKRVICIAPSAELVEQNHAKYVATDNKASIYSASLNERCLRHPVIFATPVSLKNALNSLRGRVIAVIIDEAHRTTETVKQIVKELQSRNENLRVIGLTATPYRMGTGYIYAQDPNGDPMGMEQAKDPYFMRCVFRIDAPYLIDKGWLTPVKIGQSSAHYDTSGLERNSTGNFTAESVDRAYVGKGRLTSQIISDIVGHSVNRRGVLIFCATIEHAYEALASLPPTISAIVTGDTPKPQRARILAEFKTQRLKYVVNVSVLTTGFDAPHVDVVALLRRTESASLLQQIVGRGLRLFDGKQDCLLLDYAENLEYHAPDGDIFRPEIRVSKGASGDKLPVECPDCGFVNMFAVREDCKDIPCDKQGYALDLAGDRIYTESGQPMPVHYGRRCQGLVIVEGSAMQCGNFWSHKVCPDCETDNDIAARKCRKCSAELIDPNEKLKLDFAQFKKDPSQRQCDRVLQCVVHEHISSNGNRGLKIQWVTPYRRFTTFHVPGYYWPFAGRGVDEMLTTFASKKPETITYRKEKSGYYAMLGLNQAEDVAP